jgi:DNA mismatch repair protein MutS
VLDRLREAKGSGDESRRDWTVQAVFDLRSGQFSGGATSDGGEADPLDPATESVLAEFRGTDVNETPPVELLAKVQEWQSRLREE